MALGSSLGEALCLVNILCDNHMDSLHQLGTLSVSPTDVSTRILSPQTSSQDQIAVITSPPELRLRNAVPEPQNGDSCQQAEQSASQAIQQASQQASQSIQQASQQASQSAAQASRSASQAIQQAQQSASQSIADAQRSVSSAISSASSAISSVEASAADAMSRASGQMQSAQISASAAQSVASKAVLQAGAAVAAATGSAAEAGSSFLAAAAKATQSAQASVSAFGAAAASQVAQASQQVTASQTQAVTATQAALAIVGSVIASTLITILIYFLVIRHKEKAKRRSRRQQSPRPGYYPSDSKFPVSDEVDTTIAASQSNYTPAVEPTSRGSQGTLSLFPKTEELSKQRSSVIKTSTIPWNPANPPKAPSLGSWLKVQDGVSPFGPINLPTDIKTNSPLGGQLKSPLRTINKTDLAPGPRLKSNLPLRSPTLPVMIESRPAPPVSIVKIPPKRNPKVKKPATPSPEPKSAPPQESIYRQSKASVWTDEVPDDGPSPALQSPPRAPNEPASLSQGYAMQLPSPKLPVRSTAEWLLDRGARDSSNSATSQPQSFGGLPRNPRTSRGIQSNTGLQRPIQSMEGDVQYVQGLNRFLGSERERKLSTTASDGSDGNIPGRAM